MFLLWFRNCLYISSFHDCGSKCEHKWPSILHCSIFHVLLHRFSVCMGEYPAQKMKVEATLKQSIKFLFHCQIQRQRVLWLGRSFGAIPLGLSSKSSPLSFLTLLYYTLHYSYTWFYALLELFSLLSSSSLFLLLPYDGVPSALSCVIFDSAH